MTPSLKRAWCRLSSGVLLTLALCLTMLSVPALAQQPSKVRIGYLTSSSYVHPAFADLFFGRVSIAGGPWGGNLELLGRFAAGSDDRLPSLAAELVAARVDIIVADGIPAALAAKTTTRTVPIVMAISGDPVQAGLVASLARPGGNITGVTTLSLELVAKRLQLIKEVVPKASRVAVLWNPASPEKELEWKELRSAASRLGVTLQSLELRRPGDLAPRLDSAVNERAGALLLLDDSLTLSLAVDITTEVDKRRLPAIYGWDRYMTGENKGPYGVRSFGVRAREHGRKIRRQDSQGRQAGGPSGTVVSAVPGKTRITIRLDTEVIDWFKAQVNGAGGGNYQSLINEALKRNISQHGLERTLRRLMREELRRVA